MTDEEIDEAALSDPDAQPTAEEFWQNVQVVMPRSEFIGYAQIDPDVLNWFKQQGKGYRKLINTVLCDCMDDHISKETMR